MSNLIPPWYSIAKKFNGKNENDPAFNKEMSKKWSLFGMSLGTIAGSWAAWCGLAMAVALAGAGLSYQKDGSLAKNWDKYGIEINWRVLGIPKGAIVRLNHGGDCNNDAHNHVTMANGDCTPQDLLKSGATFDGYGGNQDNTWKVSTYGVNQICSVKWPKDYALPSKVEQSQDCTSAKKEDKSTR